MDKMDKIDKDHKRTFIASSEMFSGYTVNLCLINKVSLDDIIIDFKNSLKKIFNDNNLNKLEQIVNDTNFHIHDYTIDDIITSDSNHTFFICDHS